MSLVGQDIIRKKRVDENAMELDAFNNESGEYKKKATSNSAFYIKKLTDYLLTLYYLVFEKCYSKKKNTWKPILVIQHLKKLISLFIKIILINQ